MMLRGVVVAECDRVVDVSLLWSFELLLLLVVVQLLLVEVGVVGFVERIRGTSLLMMLEEVRRIDPVGVGIV